MNHSLGWTVLVLVVYALAAARIVRFFNHDTLLDGVRAAIETRSRAATRSEAERSRWSKLSLFLACPWCVSIWVCAGTVWAPMWFADNRVVQYVAVVLAVSYLVGLANPLVADEEIDFEPDDGS